MTEHRTVWFFTALAMLGVGIWWMTDEGGLFGALLVAGAILCACAGLGNRDYMGRKPDA